MAGTEHLLDQGWKRPACITGPRSAPTAMQRRRGFEDAVAARKIKTAKVVHRSFSIHGGRTAAARLFDDKRPPDSLFVANGPLALGVLQELRSRDVRPGRDVGLICFDDAPWAPFIEPPISVVAQPAYRIGAQAARLLVARITASQQPPSRVVLGTELIVRASSLRP